VYDAYFNDDWRILTMLTINAGLRWEYGAPITELARAPGESRPGTVASTAAAPVVGSNPVGSLTGTHYPASLIRRTGAGSSRASASRGVPFPLRPLWSSAGYGIYHDTSVYQNIVPADGAAGAALDEPERPEQRIACPLTLANGFTPCCFSHRRHLRHRSQLPRRLRAGMAVVVQRDLPGAADDGNL
jgi:hypothetical protein